MKWTKDKLDLFFAMKEEGCSIEEICNALGCERQAIYDKTKSLMQMNGGRMPKYKGKAKNSVGASESNDKSNDKGDKAMSKYPEKTAKADAAEVWRMFDEGKTRKEIAEHFGVSLQTICNRITAGRPKTVAADAERECKFKETEDSASTGAKTEAVEIVPETVESIPETTEDITKTTEDITEISEPDKRPAAKPDLLKLAIRAASMATSAGFVADHMVLDGQDGRDFIRVSGKGADGMIYEIEFSATHPMYFCT